MTSDNSFSSSTLPFSIPQLKIAPWGSSSKLAYEHPGEEYFTDRHHFLTFRDTSHIGVFITVLNEQVLRNLSSRRKQYIRLTASLHDLSTGSYLSARTADIQLGRDKLITTQRTDIPLNIEEIDYTHQYEIELTDNASGSVVNRTPLAFYSLKDIKVLPNHWFEASEASLRRPEDFTCEYFRNTGANFGKRVMIRFLLRLNSSLHLPAGICELILRIHTPNGESFDRIVEPAVLNTDLSTGNPTLIEVCGDCSISDKQTGCYCCELLCMGYAFTGIIFNTGFPIEHGVITADEMGCFGNTYSVNRCEAAWDKIYQHRKATAPETTEMTISLDTEPQKSGLDSLIGLDEVKAKVDRNCRTALFNTLRQRCGLPTVNMPLHAIFAGSPGTGKTTVAQIIGERLHQSGVLSKGHVVRRERSTLVGRYYGDEEKFTREAIEEANGGILFIDEAYQLFQRSDPRDPGRLVIETLMTALSDENNRDWMLILAGYTEPMMRLFELNPGLRSRIPESNVYHFADYSPVQLEEIAINWFSRYEFRLTAEARDALRLRLTDDWERRDETFGNARHVLNLIQTEIIPALAMRVTTIPEVTSALMTTIEEYDIPASSKIQRTIEPPRIGFAV